MAEGMSYSEQMPERRRDWLATPGMIQGAPSPTVGLSMCAQGALGSTGRVPVETGKAVEGSLSHK